MSDETIASLMRAEGITEGDVNAYMSAHNCVRTDAVKALYSTSRANKIADMMFTVAPPLTPEQEQQIIDQRARVETIIAEQRVKEARKTTLREQIAGAAHDGCATCALYAELVSL